jgi:hypothetical protein
MPFGEFILVIVGIIGFISMASIPVSGPICTTMTTIHLEDTDCDWNPIP